MKHRKVFRSKFSYSKGEISRATISAGMGFNLPVQVLADNRGSFSRESFGLSDSNKFFPELNIANDIVPKPEDFIEAPFRLISATIVAGGTWRATDFSKGNVLRDSYAKLNNKPVYKDHDTDIDAWVGVVRGAKWTESFTDSKNVRIPAGIDAILAIDAKTNPKIARGVLAGGIFSNSVTVDFDWVPSHDIDNQYEFENLVGTYGADGRMITREVVKIHDYYESSLCWLGADPYAKLIDKEGNLVNVDITSTYDAENQTVRDRYTKENRYNISLCWDKSVISLSKLSNNTKPISNMEEILKALRLALGLAENAEVTVDMVANLKPVGSADEALTKKANNFAKLSKLSVVSLSSEEAVELVPEGTEEVADTVATEMVVLKKVDFEQLKSSSSTLEELKIGEKQATKEAIASLQAEAAKVPTLTTEVEGLKAEKATLEPLATEGTKYLNAKKDEAIRLYKLQAGAQVSEAVVKLFQDANSDALDGLLSQHTKGLAAKFSGKCGKCGSEEFEFRSSLAAIEDNAGAGEAGEAMSEDVSFNAIHSKFDKSEIN